MSEDNEFMQGKMKKTKDTTSRRRISSTTAVNEWKSMKNTVTPFITGVTNRCV